MSKQENSVTAERRLWHRHSPGDVSEPQEPEEIM